MQHANTNNRLSAELMSDRETVRVVLSNGCVPPRLTQIRDTEIKRAIGVGNPNNASGHDFVQRPQVAVRPSSIRPMFSCLAHHSVMRRYGGCPSYRY